MKKAYTLVELMTVISIIAIVAAVLFPVFGFAREKARESSCLNSIRGIGSALLMYATDNDGAFPDADGWDGRRFISPRGVDGKGDAAAFRCPSVNYAAKDEHGNPQSAYPGFPAYAINAQAALPGPGLKQSAIVYPSCFVLVAESIPAIPAVAGNSHFFPLYGADRHQGRGELLLR